MRKTHRKIVSGALLCGCALFTLYGASRIAERAEQFSACREARSCIWYEENEDYQS